MAWLFPRRLTINARAIAALELRGAPAVERIVAKLPDDGLNPPEKQPAFSMTMPDDGPYKTVSVTRAEAEQWLQWRSETDAAWTKTTAITSIVAAVSAIAAVIVGVIALIVA